MWIGDVPEAYKECKRCERLADMIAQFKIVEHRHLSEMMQYRKDMKSLGNRLKFANAELKRLTEE